MIFVNSKAVVKELVQELNENNFKVSFVCGGMDKYERSTNMKEFRNSKTNVLISTDVLARGIDFQ